MNKRVRVIAINPKNKTIPLIYFEEENKYSLPGGKKEEGEKSKQTAKRELLTETGIVAGKLKKLGVFKKGKRSETCFITKSKKLDTRKIHFTETEKSKNPQILFCSLESALTTLEAQYINDQNFHTERDLYFLKTFLETFLKIEKVLET